MKTKIIIATAIFSLAAFGVAVAVIIQPFPGWRTLTDKSNGIIIARCLKTPNPSENKYNGIPVDLEGGLIDSQIEVRMVLKGATNGGTTQIKSQYWPRQGENYLIFATQASGPYQAIEDYRIIPLGIYFPTNIVTSKTLDEQIREVIRYRLDLLQKELVKLQQEKMQLEEGIRN